MMLDEHKVAQILETAIIGARKVTRDRRGWSRVSQDEIVAMAMMLRLLFDAEDQSQ